MKNYIQSYFNFSKKERLGILTIVSFCIILIYIPSIYPYFFSEKTSNIDAFKQSIAQLQIQQNDSTNKYSYAQNDDANNLQNDLRINNFKIYTIKGELFYFDPNTISINDWKKLGVRDKTIATIENYLNKGGKFYEPEDLGKIWGFFPNEIERLTPYVKIAPIVRPIYFDKKSDYKPYEKKTYTPTLVDINLADTTAYIELPGIGSKLANRIVAYREKLGGFYKIDQVAETFGLPDSTFQKLKQRFVLKNSSVKQLNINTATLDELKIHPYLRYTLANAIVQYRIQHGNFKTTEDIKKIMIITEEIYNKLQPYIVVN